MDKFWNVIYRNIRESNVILEVLDARNPLGTRHQDLEEYIKRQSKTLILILNKSDLVPVDVLKQWKAYLESEFPTIFMSATRNARKNWDLLKRTIKKSCTDDEIYLLVIGYPNVGKSSLINCLFRGKKSVQVSPEAGHTRGKQYLRLSAKFWVIDTPGVIHYDEDDEVNLALKNAMRVENVKDILGVVERILELVPSETLRKIYSIDQFSDAEEFLELVGRAQGKLKKSGIPDIEQVGKIVVRDWQRNKIPYYMRPP
ncbi:MAG: GTPase [Candidatus Helarchaeota archaeon]